MVNRAGVISYMGVEGVNAVCRNEVGVLVMLGDNVRDREVAGGCVWPRTLLKARRVAMQFIGYPTLYYHPRWQEPTD